MDGVDYFFVFGLKVIGINAPRSLGIGVVSDKGQLVLGLPVGEVEFREEKGLGLAICGL